MRAGCFILLYLFVQLLTAQSRDYCILNRFSETPYFDSSEVKITRNIVYAVMPRWPGTGVDTLKLDIYEPDPSADPLEKRPAIVFFYGGAWLTGSKNDAGIRQKCFEWARRGFVVIAPNYKLGWNCNGTDILGVCVACQTNYYDLNTAIYRGARDAKASLRWVAASAGLWGIDTANLFTGGESAGSFNAMHATFWTNDYARKVFNGNPYKTLGSIDSAGPFPGYRYTVKGVINNCGAVVSDTALKLNKVPVVGFHDAADCVVPYQSNQLLNCCATSFTWANGSKWIHDKLLTNGAVSELHTVTGLTPNHCSYPALTMVRESSCFLKRLFCQNAASSAYNYPTTPAISCNAMASVKRAGKLDFTVYPNPAADIVKMRFSGPVNAEVKLMDLSGKVLQSLLIKEAAESEIELGPSAPGLYIIEVFDKMNSNRYFRKIIKQ